MTEKTSTPATFAAPEHRLLVSFALLLGALVIGMVMSLGQAAPNAALSALFSNLN